MPATFSGIACRDIRAAPSCRRAKFSAGRQCRSRRAEILQSHRHHACQCRHGVWMTRRQRPRKIRTGCIRLNVSTTHLDGIGLSRGRTSNQCRHSSQGSEFEISYLDKNAEKHRRAIQLQQDARLDNAPGFLVGVYASFLALREIRHAFPLACFFCKKGYTVSPLAGYTLPPF